MTCSHEEFFILEDISHGLWGSKWIQCKKCKKIGLLAGVPLNPRKSWEESLEDCYYKSREKRDLLYLY